MQVEAVLPKINANKLDCVHGDGLQKGKIPAQLTAGGDRADHLINAPVTGRILLRNETVQIVFDQLLEPHDIQPLCLNFCLAISVGQLDR